MKLSNLLDCEYDIEITSLSFDSKTCVQGSLYFCLVGTNYDGHDFCEQAIQNGAVAIICQKTVHISQNIPVVVVDDTRHYLAVCSSRFYGEPSKKLKLIGITGTNGKTTTSYIIHNILLQNGRKAGLIGTNGVFYDNVSIPPQLTTPDPIDLNRILRDMVDCNIEYVVMEVSAHAISLNKIDGLHFEVVAFTNLSEDHLDYFEDMDAYGIAKAKLFQPYYSKNAVFNIDDKFGQSLYKACTLNKISYGCENPADVFAINLAMSVEGIEYVLNLNDQIEDIKFCMSGRFNMYNTLCAAAVCNMLNIPIKDIRNGIKKLTKVDGRFNIINTTKYGIIIDFAHTEEGLINILCAINEFKKGKLITVFGCGGNRDRDKRAPMGRAATNFSDYVVITSDNPRYESPTDIIEDISSGIIKDNYKIIVDRKEAIKFALGIAQQNDIVLIAGKGAEKYQEIKGEKYEYNDETFVKSIIEEQGI